MAVRIESIEEIAEEGALWDEFISTAADATVMHAYGWRKVYQNAYRHQTFYLTAREGNTLLGVLPLVLLKSALLSPHLVSLPYMDYGGVSCDGNVDVEPVLVDEARRLSEEHGAQLVLRYLRVPELALPVSHEKVTMFMELGSSEEELWKRLPSTRRNRIRKGLKAGLNVTFSKDLADLDAFYDVFAMNMRDLGSPVHSREFFRQVMMHLPRVATVALVKLEEKPIGAAMPLVFNGMISSPWISSLRPYFHLCPNQVLYWEMMKWGISNGYKILDFGRSSKDSGTFEAKRQWGAGPVPNPWHYWPDSAPPPGEDVKKLSWASTLWQKLPLPVANRIGPWLRAGIPN